MTQFHSDYNISSIDVLLKNAYLPAGVYIGAGRAYSWSSICLIRVQYSNQHTTLVLWRVLFPSRGGSYVFTR